MYYSDVNSWLGLGALKWRFGFKCSVEGELSAREAGGAGERAESGCLSWRLDLALPHRALRNMICT